MTWVWIAIVLWIAVIVAVETGLVDWLVRPHEPVTPDVRLDVYGDETVVPLAWVREYEETRP